MTQSTSKLAILAGGGSAPRQVIEACRQSGRPFFVICLEGFADDHLAQGLPHATLSMGSLRELKELCARENIDEIVMIGRVTRPSLWQLRPDWLALVALVKIGLFSLGDDGLLRNVGKVLEKECRVKLIGASDIVKDILTPEGVLTIKEPNEKTLLDIKIAAEAALDLGCKDVGQAAIALDGKIIGLETNEGTAALIENISNMRKGAGAVLVKMAKPQQDVRYDLPTIGPETVRQAVNAGLAGIAVEAGRSLFLDREKTIEAANKAGLFILGYKKEEGPPNAPLFFLVAGEASGDLLGARLMKALKKKMDGKVRFAGVGGPRMAQEGIELLFPQSDLAHMGLFELVCHLPLILRRIRETIVAVITRQPAALITIDSPDFSFRVARKLKGKGVPLIHYVAPTVWAWRPKRAKKIAQFLDHLLALLPFEPPYFTKEGLACTFVGHPLVESEAGKGDAKRFIEKFDVDNGATLLAVLPGSRMGEVKRLLPIFRDTIARLRVKYPQLAVTIPVVPHVAEIIRGEVQSWPVPIYLTETDEDKYNSFAASRAALACSGTISVELALAGLPTIIAYKIGALTAVIYRRMIKTRYATLINIMKDRAIMPEFLQEDCTAENLEQAVSKLLSDNKAREEQEKDISSIAGWLGRGQFVPSEKAADTVYDVAFLRKG